MMMDEAQPPSSSSSDTTNVPPPEPDPPPNLNIMTSPSPPNVSQAQPIRSRAQSTGTSEENQSSSSPNSSATPPWLRWSRGLTSLLDDQQGRDLFERYLDQEGCSAQLNFLWACEGLKCTASDDPPKIPQLVRSIHRHFFQNIELLGIGDTTRSSLSHAIIEGRFNEVSLFDKAESEVQAHMQANLYPNFLKSEIYLCAVNGEDESSSNLQEQLEPPHTPSGGDACSLRKLSIGGGDTSSVGSGSGITCSTEIPKSSSLNLTTALTVDVSDQKSSSGGQSPKIPSPPLSTAPSVLLPNQLQTVHEDKELSVNPQQAAHNQHNNNSKLKLTKEALHLTQRSRASVPVAPAAVNTSKISIRSNREAFSSHFHQKPSSSSTSTPLHPYHASYSSYNPVSRVDSEIQSMSSDAMTDDGAHSGHGHSARKHGAHHHSSSRNKCQQQIPSSSSSHLHLHQGGAHSSSGAGDSRRIHSGVLVDNRDNLPKYPPAIVKGVGARVPNREAEIDPRGFANKLIGILEGVKRQRDMDEKLQEKLKFEVDHHHQVVGASGGVGGPGCGGGTEENVLAAAINRLQEQDDGFPDDILDQHMSRVFSDITPKTRSPKISSPTAGRRRGGPGGPPIRPRRERDVISTFSGDSGNVHDYPSSDTLPSTMSKSRSIPSELKMQDHGDFCSVSLIGAPHPRGRFNRGGGGFGHGDSRNAPLSLMTKKTSSEFLDSGISVLSGATPTVISAAQAAPSLPCEKTDIRVAQWMDQCAEDRHVAMSRKTRRPLPEALKEVRRILTKQTIAPLVPPVVVTTQSIQVPVGPLSSSSTSGGGGLRHHSPPSSDESSSATTKDQYSISSFVFYEDTDVPYCVKIPGRLPPSSASSRSGGNGSLSNCGITLAVFKEHLPKRGNYRYFFKRECAEVYTKVVQEEITDDFQELPLFEGKIIAHLQTAVGTPVTSTAMSISDKM